MSENFYNACKKGDIGLVQKLILDRRNLFLESYSIIAKSFPYRFYISMNTYGQQLAYESDNNNFLCLACKSGNIEIVNLMMNNGPTTFHNCLRAACEGGNKEIVNLILSQGYNDLNDGLIGAALGKNIHLVEYIFNIGADKRSKNVYPYIFVINRKNLLNVLKISIISDIQSIIYQFLKIK